MSMARCPLCSSIVDTDVDLDFYGPDESEYPQACENCRDEREIDRDAEYEASRGPA